MQIDFRSRPDVKGLLLSTRSSQGVEDQTPCASSLGAARRSTRSAHDDAASLASRTSAVIFFHGRALRLVALDNAGCTRQKMLHFLRARATAPAADETGHSVALGARPRPARAAPARRRKPPRRACSPRPWSRRPFAQVPGGSLSIDNASANGLLQVQRSGEAASEAVAAHGRGLGRHRPYACAPFCAMSRAREGRDPERAVQGEHAPGMLEHACWL